MEKERTPAEVLVVQLGKAGVTESFVEELKAALKKKKTVKVKILRSAKNEKGRKEIADEVSKKCGADLKEVRGNTFILKKR